MGYNTTTGRLAYSTNQYTLKVRFLFYDTCERMCPLRIDGQMKEAYQVLLLPLLHADSLGLFLQPLVQCQPPFVASIIVNQMPFIVGQALNLTVLPDDYMEIFRKLGLIAEELNEGMSPYQILQDSVCNTFPVDVNSMEWARFLLLDFFYWIPF